MLECNGYGYPIHYSLFSHIPFSTIVYIYLQRHFSPLTTTTVHTFAIFTIERGPVYFWELRCKVSPKTITLFYTSHPPPVGYCVIAMLWLDGSSSLPFPIISAPLLSKYCIQDFAETLAELENQAKIVKSCVEIGNFDHWCIAASELVDLTNLVVWKDNSFLYWDGLISESERLRHCSQVSSQHVDSVSFSMFERARERLLAISKPSNPVPLITLSPCRNRSVDQRPSSGSTESGTAVTTLSPALPCHAAVPTETTTTSTQNGHQHPTSNLFKVAVPSTTKQPPCWTSQVQMAHAIAAASDGLGIRWEELGKGEREELGKEGREEKTQAGADGKHQPPPLPVTWEHQQGPTPGPCRHQ
jgi:hypothetical protein